MSQSLGDSFGKMKRLQLIPQAILLSMALAEPASAETCLAPQRPFVPGDPVSLAEFADLIRQEFEVYFQGIPRYLQCLDEERTRAFKEAQEVSQEYEAFVNQTWQK